MPKCKPIIRTWTRCLVLDNSIITIITPVSSYQRSRDTAVEVKSQSLDPLFIVRCLPEASGTALATCIWSESCVLNIEPILQCNSGIWSFFIEIGIDTEVAPAAPRRCCVGAGGSARLKRRDCRAGSDTMGQEKSSSRVNAADQRAKKYTPHYYKDC